MRAAGTVLLVDFLDAGGWKSSDRAAVGAIGRIIRAAYAGAVFPEQHGAEIGKGQDAAARTARRFGNPFGGRAVGGSPELVQVAVGTVQEPLAEVKEVPVTA